MLFASSPEAVQILLRQFFSRRSVQVYPRGQSHELTFDMDRVAIHYQCLQAQTDIQQSENALGSSGPGIRLDSINKHDRPFHSAKVTASGFRELETDDDGSSRKGIVRKTDIYVS
jgi:hypothetical protein